MKRSNYNVFYKDIRRFGVSHAVEHTVNMGFDSVEIFDTAKSTQWLSDREKLMDLKEKLFENSLYVSCYSVAANLLSENTDDVMDSVFRHIKNAAEIGSPYFHHTLVPGLDFSKNTLAYDEVFSRIIDNAVKIAAACNERGIVCLYEPQGAYFNGVTRLKHLLDEVRKHGCNVGVCGDVGNPLFVDCQPAEIFKAFSDDIRHIHIKDYLVCEEARENAFVSVGGKYLAPVTVGEGDADVKKCLSFLKEYNGVVSFEINADDKEMEVSVNRVERFFYE